MNKELKKIANSFAEEHGSDAIYPAHLFKAILHQEIGLVHFLETELDKDYYYLQDWADVQMQMAPKSARPMRDLEYSEESLAVMDEAENYQRKFGLDECTDLCVLASLVTPGVGFPFDVLKTLPLTPAEISEKVGNGVSVEAPDMGSTPTATSSGKGGLGKYCTDKTVTAIFDIHLKGLVKLLNEQDITLQLTPEARKTIALRGYNQQYGARPVLGVIRKELRNPISKMIIGGKVKAGDTLVVDVDQDGKVLFETKADNTFCHGKPHRSLSP